MALGASASWAFASFVTVGPLKVMSVIRFALVRFFLVAIVFSALSFSLNGFVDLSGDRLNVLILSGVIGIGVGETLLYFAIKECGPQNGLFLFSLNIPTTFVAACVFGLRDLTFLTAIGAASVTVGVLFGVRARASTQVTDERVLTPLGVGAGIVAAIAQSIGLFLVKSGLEAGVSVIGVTAVRAMSATVFLGFVALLFERKPIGKWQNRQTLKDILLSTALSSGLGMFLANTSLKYGSPTIAAACLSLSPMIISVINIVVLRQIPGVSLLLGSTMFIIGIFLLS